MQISLNIDLTNYQLRVNLLPFFNRKNVCKLRRCINNNFLVTGEVNVGLFNPPDSANLGYGFVQKKKHISFNLLSNNRARERQ